MPYSTYEEFLSPTYWVLNLYLYIFIKYCKCYLLVTFKPMILEYNGHQSHKSGIYGRLHIFSHTWLIAKTCHSTPDSSLSCQRDEETINQWFSHANPCVKQFTVQNPICVSADLKPLAKNKQKFTAAC